MDVAENIKKYGGFVPGIRPGRPTAEYIDKVLSRLTLAGGVFLRTYSNTAKFRYWINWNYQPVVWWYCITDRCRGCARYYETNRVTFVVKKL